MWRRVVYKAYFFITFSFIYYPKDALKRRIFTNVSGLSLGELPA